MGWTKLGLFYFFFVNAVKYSQFPVFANTVNDLNPVFVNKIVKFIKYVMFLIYPLGQYWA